jgi:hypothetical protein
MPITATEDMLASALWYGKNHIPAFPLHTIVDGKCSCWEPDCDSPGKHPLTQHGFKDATTDEKQIRDWWKAHPDANIGIPTGAATGLLVVDIDPRNGGPEDRSDFIQQFGPIPKTAEVITGSGGRHLLFRYSGGPVPKTLAKGIDLKGDGGYVVAPPSQHASGRRYEVDGVDGAKAFLNIADAPPWLLARIARPEKTRAARGETVPAGTAIPEGERNETLFRLACSLRAKGLSGAAILAALKEENRIRCSPPLPDREVETIAASAGRYEQGNASSVVSVEIPLHEATIADLNRLAVFSGRMRFEAIWRRGFNTFARIDNGRETREVRWGCDAELLSFAKSQSVLMGAGVLIPSPRKGDIRPRWETAVQMILTLADTDRVDTGDEVVLETEERLSRTFTSAGKPVAIEEHQMALYMAALANYRRNPAAGDSAPPCVFVAEGRAWVHVPTWRAWLSTPQGYNRLYMVRELHDGLAAVGFRSAPNVVRRADGFRHQLDLWCGDIPDCLVDNEIAY